MNMRNKKSTYDIRQHVITTYLVERTSEHIPKILTLERLQKAALVLFRLIPHV